FQVVNNAEVFKTFTVRKKYHRMVNSDGEIDEAVFAKDGDVYCEPLYADETDPDVLADPSRKGCSCERTERLDCTAGSEGCACETGNTCDGGLTCSGGYCQPTGCSAGSEHCRCDDGLCNE